MRPVIVVLLAVFVSLACAQDPAPSWVAWAHASCPGRITHLEATTVVPPLPSLRGVGAQPAFWFGIEDAANVNLLQPIVPAYGQCVPDQYCVFNEQFRWNGMRNWDGETVGVVPGDALYASLTLARNGSYVLTIRVTGSVNVTQTDVRTPAVLEGKNFTNAYFVFEHHESCAALPPGGLTYSNVALHCDGVAVPDPHWRTATGVQHICDARVTVRSPSRLSLTWANKEMNAHP